MKAYKLILLGITTALFLSGTLYAQVSVSAKVEFNGELYPGENFTYSVQIAGGPKAEKINIAPLSAFNPVQTNNTRQSMNGYVTNIVGFRCKAPAQPGPVHIDPVSITIDGRSYMTNAVDFTVAATGTTDKLKLNVTLSETNCYVGQPILLEFEWLIMTQGEDVDIEVPLFRSPNFLFEDATPLGQKGGNAYKIHNVPVELRQTKKLIKGVETFILSFDKIIIPQKDGLINIEPITTSIRIPIGRVRTNDFFQPYRTKYKRFSVQSKPLSLDVKALPETNKPIGYYGLIGHYTISTEASPTTVNVGDPITLKIRIGGNPLLKPVQWPQLEKVEALAANFRIPAEKGSPTLENGYKVFTQTIRANNDQITEIPPIPLPTFDTKTGTYTLVTSKPIPITVAASKVLDSDDLGGLSSTPVNRKVEAIKEGLAANYGSDDALQNQAISLTVTVMYPPAVLLWGAPLLGFILSAITKVARHTNPQQIANKRRRSAIGKAKRALQGLKSATPEDRPEQLAQILRQYVGDRFDKTAGSLTAVECHHTVKAGGSDESTASALQDIVAMCEAARYAPTGSNIDEQTIAQALDLIQTIDKAAK